jgi:hypothetical protein
VISKPDDISSWVSLLVLPLCILKSFRPRSSSESRSFVKRRHQEESISRAICSWSAPGGILQLVRDTLAEDTLLFQWWVMVTLIWRNVISSNVVGRFVTAITLLQSGFFLLQALLLIMTPLSSSILA